MRDNSPEEEERRAGHGARSIRRDNLKEVVDPNLSIFVDDCLTKLFKFVGRTHGVSPTTRETADARVWSQRVKIATTTSATTHHHGGTAPATTKIMDNGLDISRKTHPPSPRLLGKPFI